MERMNSAMDVLATIQSDSESDNDSELETPSSSPPRSFQSSTSSSSLRTKTYAEQVRTPSSQTSHSTESNCRSSASPSASVPSTSFSSPGVGEPYVLTPPGRPLLPGSGSGVTKSPSTPSFETPESASVPNEPSVKEALKEITSLLNVVVQRMDRVEDELRQKQSMPSAKNSKKKCNVPLIVKVGSYDITLDKSNIFIFIMHVV